MADYFEGCGEEGPIRGIFFSEFHPKQGPIIRCQVPENDPDHAIPKEAFDVIAVYIIPKPELTERAITLNVHGRKICGYPRVINDNKYKRNQFMFNVCFVCYPWSRTVQFESPLRKLSEFLLNLELEAEFLSNEDNTPRLKAVLEDVFNQLNDANAAILTVENNMLNLKVMSNKSDPPGVNDWDVPVICVAKDIIKQSENEWDLTSQQILPHIDGCNHIVRISEVANVEIGLVKACVQNLIYHRVVHCIPHVFQYCNQYMVTPEIRLFRENAAFRTEFMKYLYQDTKTGEEKPAKATFSDIFKLIAEFKHGTTVKDICLRNRPKRTLGIDMFRLVQYLVLKGIIRRLQRYPFHLRYDDMVKERCGNNSVEDVMYRMFDGHHHLDEICMKCQMSNSEIMAKIEADSEVLYLTR